MTMSDHNSDEHPTLSDSSQTQNQQQTETTMNTHTLSTFDIPSSDLGLDSIIAPSELESPPKPEQWAELDSQF
jgi:hypothetical protein